METAKVRFLQLCILHSFSKFVRRDGGKNEMKKEYENRKEREGKKRPKEASLSIIFTGIISPGNKMW